MTIIQIDPLETGQHPIQSQSGRRACWLEGYIEVPAHLHDAVWATYGWCDLQIEGDKLVGITLLSGSRAGAGTPAAPRRGHHSGHAVRARGAAVHAGTHRCHMRKETP
jgi:hypothetical protein